MKPILKKDTSTAAEFIEKFNKATSEEERLELFNEYWGNYAPEWPLLEEEPKKGWAEPKMGQDLKYYAHLNLQFKLKDGSWEEAGIKRGLMRPEFKGFYRYETKLPEDNPDFEYKVKQLNGHWYYFTTYGKVSEPQPDEETAHVMLETYLDYH